MRRIEDMIPPYLKLVKSIDCEHLALLMAREYDLTRLRQLELLYNEGAIDKHRYDEPKLYYSLMLDALCLSSDNFKQNRQRSAKRNEDCLQTCILVDEENSLCGTIYVMRESAFKWANEQFAKMYGEPEKETETIKQEQDKPLRENERQTFLKIVAGLTHIVENSNIGHLKYGNNANKKELASIILKTIGQPLTDEKGSDKTQTLARKISEAIEKYPNIQKPFLESPEEK